MATNNPKEKLFDPAGYDTDFTGMELYDKVNQQLIDIVKEKPRYRVLLIPIETFNLKGVAKIINHQFFDEWFICYGKNTATLTELQVNYIYKL